MNVPFIKMFIPGCDIIDPISFEFWFESWSGLKEAYFRTRPLRGTVPGAPVIGLRTIVKIAETLLLKKINFDFDTETLRVVF